MLCVTEAFNITTLSYWNGFPYVNIRCARAVVRRIAHPRFTFGLLSH